MSKLYSGVYDATNQTLAITSEEEIDLRIEVESLVPNIWKKFREACLNARSLMLAHQTNKTSVIRADIKEIQKDAAKLFEKIQKMSPVTHALFPSGTYDTISELLAMIELAGRHAQELPTGNQPLIYRDFLAKSIADLMKENNVQPKLVRDISTDAWKGDHTYASLLRNAIILVEGKDSLDLFKHMQAGLK